MAKSTLYRGLFVLLIVLSTGCAGSGSGKSGTDGKSYSAQIGIAYQDEFWPVTRRVVLDRYQYQVTREEESPRQLYFETAWKERSVFADEVEMGITAAQTRIILRANARHIGQYKIQFYAENEYQYAASGEWRSGPMSKELKHYLSEIAGRLKHEFRLLY
jgi:hypothetical protein